MLVAFAVRTGLAGAYLTALMVHGSLDTFAALLAVAVVLIWAAPVVRTAARRHRHRPVAAGPREMSAPV